MIPHNEGGCGPVCKGCLYEAEQSGYERGIRDARAQRGGGRIRPHAPRAVASYGDALTRRVAELEKALKRIAVEHCNYKDNADDYDTGVTDGHRCAAQIARDVLALTALAASQAPRKDGET